MPVREVLAITEHQQSIFELNNPGRDNGVDRMQEPVSELESYRELCLKCNLCVLRSGCSGVVFGDGNPDARMMLIGEGPGAEEDRLGVPFVGAAGKLLDRILEAVEVNREDIYIANIVKCRPPGNRLPLQPEVEACLPHLKKQIDLIDPEIIVCMGALATRTLLDKSASITRTRGRWHNKDGRFYMATFHPAALLRDPGKKKYSWEDFKLIAGRYHQVENGGISP